MTPTEHAEKIYLSILDKEEKGLYGFASSYDFLEFWQQLSLRVREMEMRAIWANMEAKHEDHIS